MFCIQPCLKTLLKKFGLISVPVFDTNIIENNSKWYYLYIQEGINFSYCFYDSGVIDRILYFWLLDINCAHVFQVTCVRVCVYVFIPLQQ